MCDVTEIAVFLDPQSPAASGPGRAPALSQESESCEERA
jgi:hypothetical protein